MRLSKALWNAFMASSLIACAGLLSNCKSAEPSIARTTIALPFVDGAQFSRTPSPEDSEPGPAVAPELLTLDRAIEQALAASPELEQIERRIDAAAEQVRQAESEFYPRIVLSEEFNATNNPVYAMMNIINQKRLTNDTNFNDPGEQQDFASRVQAEWSLFSGGSDWKNRSAAINQRGATEAELQAARNRLVASVCETYHRWLQAIAFIGVAEKSLESARTNQKLGEARLEVEMALPTEVLRLKTQSAEAENNLLTAKTSARKMGAAMERLLASAIRPSEIPDPRIVADYPPPSPNAPRESDGALVEQALGHRPEMESVRLLARAARDRVCAAKGSFLPRLSAGAQYWWDSENFGLSEESWMASLQASWPVFEGGLRLSKVREAEAAYREMQAKGKQMALDIALEVHQAALSVQEADDKIRVAAVQAETARQALSETRNLYENQVVAVDSLLQAEVAWDKAETSYLAALFDGKIADALLRRALGDFVDNTAKRAEQ